MDLAIATNAPMEVPVGGRMRPVRAMTLDDWGALTAWIKSHVPSPLEAAARAVEAARDRGEPLAEWVADVVVDRAMAAAQAWPPALLSERWLVLLDEVEDGTARFLLALLGACDPSFTIDEARELARSIDRPELWPLVHLARHGELPPPKSRASAGGKRRRAPSRGRTSGRGASRGSSTTTG